MIQCQGFSIRRIGVTIAAAVLGAALLAGVSASPDSAYAAESAGGGLAAGGVSAQANGPYSDGSSISFDQYDALGNYVDDQDARLYSSYEGSDVKASWRGMSYNKATNTLTLNGCDNPYGRLNAYGMGDDFKINVVGVNALAAIEISDGTDKYDEAKGEWQRVHQGASLTIAGTGTLNVNKQKTLSYVPVQLSSEYYGADIENNVLKDNGGDPIKLEVASTANFNVYSDGSCGCIWIGDTTLSKGSAFVFKGVVTDTQAYTHVNKWSKTEETNKYYDAEDDEWYSDTKTVARLATGTYDYTIMATELHCTAKNAKVGGATYTFAKAKGGALTAKLKKAPNKKKVTVPKAVNMNGQKFAVTGIAKGAFKSAKKCKTANIKTTKLTKKSVKGAFKGAKKLKTVKVPKKVKKAYKKFFTKGNSGKKVSVK